MIILGHDLILTKFVSPLFHPHEEWKFTQKGKYLFAWGGGLEGGIQLKLPSSLRVHFPLLLSQANS